MAKIVRAMLWTPPEGNSNDATDQIANSKLKRLSPERPETFVAKSFKSLQQNNVTRRISTLINDDNSPLEHRSDSLNSGRLTSLMLAITGRNRDVDNEQRNDDHVIGDVVEKLIKNGADIHCRSPTWEETTLHLAARYDRTLAAKHLLEAGAETNARDKTGRTPLHLAVTADAQGVFQILLRHRATDLNAQCEDGATPLIYAARFLTNNMMEQLVNIGASINMTDKQGKTALHWAAYVGNEEGTALLLKYNAMRNLQDKNGQTPLFLASKEGSVSIVQMLLSSFANRHLQDDMGQSPLSIALERDHTDTAELFWEWSFPAPMHYSPSTQFSLIAHNISFPQASIPNNVISVMQDEKWPRKQRTISDNGQERMNPTTFSAIA